MPDTKFDEWLHYQQPNIPTLQDAFAEGEKVGIAYAEKSTAEKCAEIAHNWQDSKTGLSCCHRLDIEAEIREKFKIDNM